MVKIFMHENIVFIYFSALLLLVGTNGNSILFYKTAQFSILPEIKCISRHVLNKLAVLCCFDRLVNTVDLAYNGPIWIGYIYPLYTKSNICKIDSKHTVDTQ